MIGLKDQCFGVEVEMTGITREQAATALAAYFATDARYVGGAYDKWCVTDRDGKEWTVMSDSSIHGEQKIGSGYRATGDYRYRVEMVTPKLTYAELPKLQECVRQVRHAGTSTPEAQKSFELETANLSLSLGVPKGPFSFAKENGPFDSPPARCRDRSSPFGLQNPRALWARNPSSAATLESAQKKEHPCGCSFSSLS